MQKDDHNWSISIIKDRYAFLALTDEQAEQVYNFEANNRAHAGKNHFTDWEEFDYEWHFFSQILDEVQLAKYSKKQKKKISWFEKGLRESMEQTSLQKIEYTAEIINYYEEHLLPAVFSASLPLGFELSLHEKSKVDLLKSEYKKHLHESRRLIIINHFKYYRTLCPVTLKSSLLNHKLYYLWPDYRSFKFNADEPTKAVASFVETQLMYVPKETDVLFRSKIQDGLLFFDELNKRYYSEYPAFRYGNSSEKEEKTDRLMTLVLMDRGKYGWNDSLLT